MTRLTPVLLAASLTAFPLLDAHPAARADSQADTRVCGQDVEVGHIIRDGHQDLRPLPDGTVVVNDEGTKRGSGTFSVAVPSSTKVSQGVGGVPGPVFYLDVVQDHSVPWFGFSTEKIDSGADFSLSEVSGPGRIIAWANSLSNDIDILLDSSDPRVVHTLPKNTHEHVNWSFTEPGAYSATFTVRVDGRDTELQTTFLVGDDAINDAEDGTVTIECADPDTTALDGAGDDDPKQIAKDLDGLAKEITALDKAWGGFTDQVLKEVYPSGQPTTSASPKPAPKSSPQKAPATATARAAEPTPSGTPATKPAPAAAAQQQTPTKLRSTSVAAAPAAPGPKGVAKPAPAKKAAPASLSTVSTPTSAVPIPDAAGGAPATQSPVLAAPQSEETTSVWKEGNWWSGLTLGIGGTSLAAGVLFFFAARRVLNGLGTRP